MKCFKRQITVCITFHTLLNFRPINHNHFISFNEIKKNRGWINTVVIGVAVVTVEVVVADADVGSGRAVAQRQSADATPEAVDVVKQPQALDDHRRSSSYQIQFNRINWNRLI